jgi:hypothetical protein
MSSERNQSLSLGGALEGSAEGGKEEVKGQIPVRASARRMVGSL